MQGLHLLYRVFYRVNACIKYGLKGAGEPLFPGSNVQDITFPENGFTSLRTAVFQGEFCFSSAKVVSYFVSRSVSDGFPADDFKAINKRAENLFICGHIQCIQVLRHDSQLLFKANCLPEMKKDKVYIVKLGLNASSFDIIYAKCGCPAGKGPQGSCKHIGALSYALADYSRLRTLPEYVACTDVTQQWNIPQPRCAKPIPVEKLGSQRRELQSTNILQNIGSKMVYDPRPIKHRAADPNLLENLCCDLLQYEQKCAFINILLPLTESIEHDHCYHRKSCEIPNSSPKNEAISTSPPTRPQNGDKNDEVHSLPDENIDAIILNDKM